MFVHGFFFQSFGHPNLTGIICLYMVFLVQISKHPSLTGICMMCLYLGIGAKLWTKPVCLLFGFLSVNGNICSIIGNLGLCCSEIPFVNGTIGSINGKLGLSGPNPHLRMEQ